MLEALLLCRRILICLIITALLGGPAHYSHITDDESKIKEIKLLVIEPTGRSEFTVTKTPSLQYYLLLSTAASFPFPFFFF